jgi:hypothetical protein
MGAEPSGDRGLDHALLLAPRDEDGVFGECST